MSAETNAVIAVFRSRSVRGSSSLRLRGSGTDIDDLPPVYPPFTVLVNEPPGAPVALRPIGMLGYGHARDSRRVAWYFGRGSLYPVDASEGTVRVLELSLLRIPSLPPARGHQSGVPSEVLIDGGLIELFHH